MAAYNKKKVAFIMGSTGTGKTKLSIDLGSHFPSEIINADKIQVYKGLDIITNKVPESERRGIPHHLLGIIEDPEFDYSPTHFCDHVISAIEHITQRGHLPIIVGGSNTYLEYLVEDPTLDFRSKYDCCFLWLDVSLDVLFPYLDKRVDEMADAGFVDETREYFLPEADYSAGIRRAIGAPELHEYFKVENDANVDDETKQELLKDAIQRMKRNTHTLARVQLAKIQRINDELAWGLNRIDATEVFEAALNGSAYKCLWEDLVSNPSKQIVQSFLQA
ncbi:adenylate isopentenyltransferase 5, chloroplastic-like [Neltuma alba]|uniref:adenylate isopentenyltransferase 5, chloroplastic-like n=1 Tax=Neltuma alba TaxID=207710 RepID=UPI0010A2E5D9|nr:adenylate isopentenyltransferase 5, chloroplastic-like [Prosopis alba]XP_028805879.1 adenylate isopentenyltransferase 5, chloroplastic-like [Prosopis alba]